MHVLEHLLDDVAVQWSEPHSGATVTLTGPCRRWSGDMNTSLGNTISNLLCLRAALILTGNDPDRLIVEGDDSLCHVENRDHV